MDLSSDLAVVIVIFLMNIVPFETLHSYLPTIYRYNMVDMQLHVMMNKSGSGWTLAISYGDFSCKVCYFYCSKGSCFWACHEGRLCRGGIHSFLTSSLDRGEWSAWHPGHFVHKERTLRTDWVGDCMGPRTSLDILDEIEHSCPCQESECFLSVIRLLLYWLCPVVLR